MFVLILMYQKPLSEVEKFLSEHKTYLDKYYKTKNFIASGRQNPRVGGVILCEAENKTEVQSIIKEDPFFVNGIAKYEIVEFEPTKCSEEFKSVLSL